MNQEQVLGMVAEEDRGIWEAKNNKGKKIISIDKIR